MRARTALLAGLLLLRPSPAASQAWPEGPVTLAGGRVVLGGEATATVAPEDAGQFNQTDYERSALQLLRIGLTASARPFDRITFVTELRAEGDTAGGAWTALPFAAYVRFRPWKDRTFDIQAGRIPPVFGAAGRRIYATDNVLVGYPLAWQYLTVLRSDALPADTDELIAARGHGWKPWYSVGSSYGRGVPLATAFRYDTGVEARLGDERSPFSVSAALTAGTLSNPGARDSNGGPQVSARLEARPAIGLVLGGSWASGRFLADGVRRTLEAAGGDSDDRQQTWGADAEYAFGHFLARAELVHARWRLPSMSGPSLAGPLTATGLSTEARYRVAPGLTLGARVDRLAFSRVQGTYDTLPWDAPVTRVEAGIAWMVSRWTIVRLSVQHNARERGPRRTSTLPAAQVTLWF